MKVRKISDLVSIGFAAICVFNFAGCSSGGTATFADAAIASPFVSTSSTTGGLRLLGAAPTSPEDIADAMQALLDETSNVDNCTFYVDVTQTNDGQYANCYGPRVALSGTHDDTASAVPALPTNPGNPLPIGDTGIWDSTEGSTDEACVAAELNALFDYYTKFARFAQFAYAGFDCFISTQGISLPATGSTVTLDTTQLTEFSFTDADKGTFTPTTATVTGIEDADGNSGHKWVIIGTMAASGGPTLNFEVRASVIETSSGTKAKIAYSIPYPSANIGGCGGAGHVQAGHAVINTSGSTVKTELHTAQFCESTTDPFTSSDTIDPCDTEGNAAYTGTGNGTRGWSSNYNYLVMNYDSGSKEGKYSYAWQAGGSDSHSRVFNAEITSKTAGYGFFGFGPKVPSTTDAACVQSTSLGSIEKMICNWTGPGSDHNGQNYVQWQSMTKNSSGVWAVNQEKIRYVPTNSCTSTTFDLGYWAVVSDSDTTHLSYSLDSDVVQAAGSTRLDLETIATYTSTYTQPTRPTF